MNEIINKLIKENKTISTMESCTGGYIANEITNQEGSSLVFKFGAVTYSNEHKIKMGVSPFAIEKYSVYSTQVAKEMSKKISDYTNSTYGIGVTGKLDRNNKFNMVDDDSNIYISIYNKENDEYNIEILSALDISRKENKKLILKKIIEMLKSIV